MTEKAHVEKAVADDNALLDLKVDDMNQTNFDSRNNLINQNKEHRTEPKKGKTKMEEQNKKEYLKIYPVSRRRKGNQSIANLSNVTKPMEEKGFMATTKSKVYRKAAIQDDMNYELSRKFIGRSNTTYKKLKDLTDLSDDIAPSPGQRSRRSASKSSKRDTTSIDNRSTNKSKVIQDQAKKQTMRSSKSMNADKLEKMQMRLSNQQRMYL